jgi:hypothetical protein
MAVPEQNHFLLKRRGPLAMRCNHIEHTWFEDGQLNVSVNCLDRHLKTKGNKTAIIWQGEPENDVVKLTYAQLHQRSASSPTC